MRLIDAEPIIRQLKDARKLADSPRRDLDLLNLQRILEIAPVVDAATVVHGRWIMDGKDHCHCSECKDGRNIRTQIGWNYCPNCGAKMELPEKEKHKWKSSKHLTKS